jgi:hypothetical protein
LLDFRSVDAQGRTWWAIATPVHQFILSIDGRPNHVVQGDDWVAAKQAAVDYINHYNSVW